MAFIQTKYRGLGTPRALLVESYRDGDKIRRRVLYRFDSTLPYWAPIKHLLKKWENLTRRRKRLLKTIEHLERPDMEKRMARASGRLSPARIKDLADHKRMQAAGLEKAAKPIKSTLTKLARILNARPRTRRKLWPDADDWLKRRA